MKLLILDKYSKKTIYELDISEKDSMMFHNAEHLKHIRRAVMFAMFHLNMKHIMTPEEREPVYKDIPAMRKYVDSEKTDQEIIKDMLNWFLEHRRRVPRDKAVEACLRLSESVYDITILK